MTIALILSIAAAVIFFGLWLYELLCRFEAINEGVQEYRIALKFIADHPHLHAARFATAFVYGNDAVIRSNFPAYADYRSKLILHPIEAKQP